MHRRVRVVLVAAAVVVASGVGAFALRPIVASSATTRVHNLIYNGMDFRPLDPRGGMRFVSGTGGGA